MKLFDANCMIGRPSRKSAPRTIWSVDEILREMDYCGIEEALVFHADAWEYDPQFGNSELLSLIRNSSRLHPLWVVKPDHCKPERKPSLVVEKMLDHGAKAARMFPMARIPLPFSSWYMDELLAELEKHRIPLFVDFEKRHWGDVGTNFEGIERICATFRDLPVILVREGVGPTDIFFALFERCENLMLELSYYQTPSALRKVTQRFGAHHFLFGTGLPFWAPGPPMTMILYSVISRPVWRFREPGRSGGSEQNSIRLGFPAARFILPIGSRRVRQDYGRG